MSEIARPIQIPPPPLGDGKEKDHSRGADFSGPEWKRITPDQLDADTKRFADSLLGKAAIAEAGGESKLKGAARFLGGYIKDHWKDMVGITAGKAAVGMVQEKGIGGAAKAIAGHAKDNWKEIAGGAAVGAGTKLAARGALIATGFETYMVVAAGAGGAASGAFKEYRKISKEDAEAGEKRSALKRAMANKGRLGGAAFKGGALSMAGYVVGHDIAPEALELLKDHADIDVLAFAKSQADKVREFFSVSTAHAGESSGTIETAPLSHNPNPEPGTPNYNQYGRFDPRHYDAFNQLPIVGGTPQITPDVPDAPKPEHSVPPPYLDADGKPSFKPGDPNPEYDPHWHERGPAATKPLIPQLEQALGKSQVPSIYSGDSTESGIPAWAPDGLTQNAMGLGNEWKLEEGGSPWTVSADILRTIDPDHAPTNDQITALDKVLCEANGIKVPDKGWEIPGKIHHRGLPIGFKFEITDEVKRAALEQAKLNVPEVDGATGVGGAVNLSVEDAGIGESSAAGKEALKQVTDAAGEPEGITTASLGSEVDPDAGDAKKVLLSHNPNPEPGTPNYNQYPSYDPRHYDAFNQLPIVGGATPQITPDVPDDTVQDSTPAAPAPSAPEPSASLGRDVDPEEAKAAALAQARFEAQSAADSSPGVGESVDHVALRVTALRQEMSLEEGSNPWKVAEGLLRQVNPDVEPTNRQIQLLDQEICRKNGFGASVWGIKPSIIDPDTGKPFVDGFDKEGNPIERTKELMASGLPAGQRIQLDDDVRKMILEVSKQ